MANTLTRAFDNTAKGGPATAALKIAPAPGWTISMISQHAIELEMLSSLLGSVFADAEIRSYQSPEEWRRAVHDPYGNETVIYHIGDGRLADKAVKDALRAFIAQAGDRRVVVMSRDSYLIATCDAVECGASGYIPPSVVVDELIAALRGSSSKSVVLPRKSVEALCAALSEALQQRPGLETYFTERQLCVAKALRKGSANKIIAHELGLCESTVKVHIRSIMRKLNATNRTQAAARLNDLANGVGELELHPDH